MDLSVEPQSQDSGISRESGQKNPSDAVCSAVLTNSPTFHASFHVRECHFPPRQECSNCEAALCDLHAEFCAICLAFFCEGCLDLHNEEGQHADGNIGEIVAIVREGVQR